MPPRRCFETVFLFHLLESYRPFELIDSNQLVREVVSIPVLVPTRIRRYPGRLRSEENRQDFEFERT